MYKIANLVEVGSRDLRWSVIIDSSHNKDFFMFQKKIQGRKCLKNQRKTKSFLRTLLINIIKNIVFIKFILLVFVSKFSVLGQFIDLFPILVYRNSINIDFYSLRKYLKKNIFFFTVNKILRKILF
jgi:hypothetical protein